MKNCTHIIAYADERDANPCPVCELAKVRAEHDHLSAALVDLQVMLVDLHLPVLAALDAANNAIRTLEPRFKRYEKTIFEIQKRHGHLKGGGGAERLGEKTPTTERETNAKVSDHADSGRGA